MIVFPRNSITTIGIVGPISVSKCFDESIDIPHADKFMDRVSDLLVLLAFLYLLLPVSTFCARAIQQTSDANGW